MPEYIKLDQLKDNLDFFHKMYDTVRLIDPVHKKVIDYRDSTIRETNEICYNYWGNKVICDNCISIRAYHEDKSYVKLEKGEEAILLVTALPIENVEHPVVLELMKNATESMLMGNGDYNEGESIKSFVRELNDKVVKDSLTSIYNRRFIDERLPVDIINATLNQLPLSVCFMDLDNFKELNDTYGHEEGDRAIKAAGDVIREYVTAEGDWVARYGGDEFLICFHNMDEKEAYEVSKQIQKAIEEIRFTDDKSAMFSISFGIQTMLDVPYTAEEMIHLADLKMYEAKKRKKK